MVEISGKLNVKAYQELIFYSYVSVRSYIDLLVRYESHLISHIKFTAGCPSCHGRGKCWLLLIKILKVWDDLSPNCFFFIKMKEIALFIILRTVTNRQIDLTAEVNLTFCLQMKPVSYFNFNSSSLYPQPPVFAEIILYVTFGPLQLSLDCYCTPELPKGLGTLIDFNLQSLIIFRTIRN